MSRRRIAAGPLLNHNLAMDDLLIRDVDVLRCEGDGCTVLRAQDIAVRGSRITAVEPTGGFEPTGAREVRPPIWSKVAYRCKPRGPLSPPT